MEIEPIFSLRMFSIQGLACWLVPELHSQTEIELDSFIKNPNITMSKTQDDGVKNTSKFLMFGFIVLIYGFAESFASIIYNVNILL